MVLLGAKNLYGDDLFESGYFNLKVIKAATQNFSPANKIGEGGFGSVYKGVLPDGKAIAVKKLSTESDRGRREFQNEVDIISTLRHPNLVRLLGSCAKNNYLLLVYEYVENGCLWSALFDPGNLKRKLNWRTRVKICLGIARGIAFLHHDEDESKVMKIIHRDIKSRNVFLDKHLNPKISDFGLARQFDGDTYETAVAGTLGYIAPEALTNSIITEKVDAYSFGVLTLELMSGRRVIDRTNEDWIFLIDVAYGIQKKGEGLLPLIDEDLKASVSPKEALVILDLAMWCINDSPTLRPTMSEVASILEGRTIMKTPIPLNSRNSIRSNTTISTSSTSTEEIQISNQWDAFGPDNVCHNDNNAWSCNPFQLLFSSKGDDENSNTTFHGHLVSDARDSMGERGEDGSLSMQENNAALEPPKLNSRLWASSLFVDAAKIKDEETHKTYEAGFFNLTWIKSVTQNFSSTHKIGEGSSGSVYKGVLPNGMAVAVKKLSTKSEGRFEFLNEVNTIPTMRHPNLLALLGWCTEDNQLLLVYEYMENGSLDRALFGPVNMKEKLTWPARVRICLGIAKGLAFLHEDDSEVKIVHRDIKPSNVLLDKHLNPKISDFGLVTHYKRETTHINIELAGTIGYMAPEYVIRGTVTEKVDVYSFGIVILELMSGKHSIEWKTKHENVSLLDLAYDLRQKGDLLELIDHDLKKSISKKEVTMMLDLALLCTNDSPKLRPTMSKVVSILEGRTMTKNPSLNSPYLTRVDSERAITDISIRSLSSSLKETKITYNWKVFGPDEVSDSNDEVEVHSSHILSKHEEDNNHAASHCDFTSNLKDSMNDVGEDARSWIPISVDAAAMEDKEDTEPYESRFFNLRQVKAATQNFSSANKICEGSFGSVYKGVLPNGMAIAVKQFSIKSEKRRLEFLSEVNTISTLRHPNLVKLLGYCMENNQLILVYEYMENGCLQRALYGLRNLKGQLNWPTRVRICLGIAKGLTFLHDDKSKVKIVHRDLNPSNVLFDKHLNPKIYDFGLAKHFHGEKTHISTALAGTRDYIAPEYFIRGIVTEKTDVYSFGVVTLELMSGRPFPQSIEGVFFQDVKENLLALLDEDLKTSISVKEAYMVIELARLCTNPSPTLRPTMSEVVNILEGRTIMKTPPLNSTETRVTHQGNVFGPDYVGYDNDRTASLSSHVASIVEEGNTASVICGDILSGVKDSTGEGSQDVRLLIQANVATLEPTSFNAKSLSPCIFEDATKAEYGSKLEYIGPSFEERKLHIECSNDEFEAGCAEWKDSLVGYIVGGKPSFNVDKEMVEKLWGVEGKISVFPLENRYFLFRFDCVEDKIRVLESSDLWHIKQRTLVLREWDWKLKFDKADLKSLPVWVKIYNLPLFLWSSSFFSKLGSGLGIPLYVDKKTKNRERLAYAKLCIEVDASKPLPASLNITVKGVDYELKLGYDWRPSTCANYYSFRHIKSDLMPIHIVSSKGLLLFCLILIPLYWGYLQMKWR